MMRRSWWHEYRTTEFPPADPARCIAILPTAAIEQHGPHLPTGTDALIMEGMLATVLRLAPDDLDLRILPVQSVGKSNEHLHAPGTLTLTAEAALAAWTEIGLSVARAGLRKLVIVNSHGGNLDLIGILARELRVRAGMLAVKCQWVAFGTPAGLYGEAEGRFGIHGGDMETSLMLHFRPELVDMEAARHFRSSAEAGVISPTGPVAYGWIASDLNPHGVVGDASAATAEKGLLTAEHQARGFLALLRDMAGFELPRPA
jgi:creatinine amidohydrolase